MSTEPVAGIVRLAHRLFGYLVRMWPIGARDRRGFWCGQHGRDAGSWSLDHVLSRQRPAVVWQVGSRGTIHIGVRSGSTGSSHGQHRVKIMTGGMGAPSMPSGPAESPSKSRSRSKGMEPPKEVTLPDMVTVESGSNEINLDIPSA